jgi:hypothetical protein
MLKGAGMVPNQTPARLSLSKPSPSIVPHEEGRASTGSAQTVTGAALYPEAMVSC